MGSVKSLGISSILTESNSLLSLEYNYFFNGTCFNILIGTQPLETLILAFTLYQDAD